MKKPSLFILSIGIFLFVATSCQDNDVQPARPQDQDTSMDQLALHVVDLLQDPANLQVTTSLLKTKPAGVKLADILQVIDGPVKGTEAFGKLEAVVDASEKQITGASPDNIAVPELWLHQPGQTALDRSKLLVAFPPTGREESWTKVRAYTMDKQIVYLDAKTPPDVPVIVVEEHGFEAFKIEVSLINKKLREAGLQKEHFYSKSGARLAADGLETTKLDKIRLNDDEEPWISGAAEVYAITSGIKNSNKEAEVAVIPMYYLDKDGKDYYPNQVMLFWEDYAYQAANIQLFEKDDNHNYQDMVSMLLKDLSALAGTLSGQTWITALGTIASAIVDAMPSSTFTNDDDYVDSFYTIEKNRSYTGYYGARGNAKVNMSPYFIPAN